MPIYLPAFCGNGTQQGLFWDWEGTWNSTDPDLPVCFQDSILAWSPGLLLSGISLVYLPYFSSHKVKLKWREKTPRHIAKLILTGITALIYIASTVYIGFLNTIHTPILIYISSPFLFLVNLLVGLCLHMEFSRGMHSSYLLLLYWFLVVVLNVFPFRTKIKAAEEGTIDDLFQFVIFYITYTISVIQLGLCLVTDRIKRGTSRQHHVQEDRQNLIENEQLQDDDEDAETAAAIPRNRKDQESVATALSIIFNAWFYGLYRTGWKRPLQFSDLFDIPVIDKCKKVIQYIKPVFASGKRVSVLKMIFYANKRPLLISAVGRVVIILTDLAGPLLLNWFLQTVKGPTAPEWQGYFIALCFFINNLVQCLSFNVYRKNYFILVNRIRSAINASVYRKALKITAEARARTTVGELVNIISVDVDRIRNTFFDIHELWASPLMIGLSLLIQYHIIGPSCLASLVVFAIYAPLNGFIFVPQMTKAQDRQMEEKDRRIKVLSEMLNGIKVLKMYVWEPSFIRKLESIRKEELKFVKKETLLNCASKVLWYSSPFFMLLATFTTYVLSSPDNILTPQRAFTIYSLIDMYNELLSFFPIFMSDGAQSVISLRRIGSFLNDEELQDIATTEGGMQQGGIVLRFDKAEFAWNKNETKILKNINLSVENGDLVGIVGKVGMGKSSLLSAAIGEMAETDGSVSVRGSLAYVPQQAWILNATLRDNILFGEPFEEDRYWSTLQACALMADLKILPAGDMTEIGEKGVNLSGGQKQRVSLARAVYQNRDIYLLDDPLSAVDAHVGQHIFQHVVGPEGLLSSKTRLLVTHGLHYLKDMHHVILMEHGEIIAEGEYSKLIDENQKFAEYVKSDTLEEEEEEKEQEESQAFKRQLSRLESVDKQSNDGKLVLEEVAETGRISKVVMMSYVRSCGWGYTILVIVSFLGYTAAAIGLGTWLQLWSDDSLTNNHSITYWLVGFALLSLIRIITTAGLSIGLSLGALNASMTMHGKLLLSVLRSPMSFFDSTPSGRIINRFSSDMDEADNEIADLCGAFLYDLAAVSSSAIIIIYTLPIFLAFFVPFIIFFALVYWINITTSRHVKRIMSIQKSPVYTNLEETLQGVSSIRAYQHQERFTEKNDNLIDDLNIANYAVFLTNRCMGVASGTVGAIALGFASLFACIQKDRYSTGQLGLVVSYATLINFQIHFALMNLAESEKRLVAIERILEYSKLSSEAPWTNTDQGLDEEWPSKGEIRFKNLSVRYKDGLPLVLSDVTATINSTEKVGIVGRTGAGKSSLVSCLFRLHEPASGTILIDDVDVMTLGLHDLRSKIAVIPQDPIMFSGTMRQNLDPFGSYEDEEVWKALERAHLKETVKTTFGGLDYDVGEGGVNLSVGQRQLVCLARCLLKRTKILVLDEATAAVDLHTDELIQKTIRQEFRETTILTIAHRINTILDYDRIIVMDKGEIKEFDTPTNLLDQESIFASLVQSAKTK